MKSGVSSATLITVSLITAVATLLAATLASWITNSVAKRNLKHAAEEAEKDRNAKVRLEVRGARREAYASFLTACLKAVAKIQTAPDGHSLREMDEDFWNMYRSETRSALHDVLSSQSLVAVEGPSEVIKASVEARRAVRKFRKTMRDLHMPGLEVEAKEEAQAHMTEAKRVAEQAVNAFAKAARTLLND